MKRETLQKEHPLAALPAERRVSARRGWAGEIEAFLSILQECSSVVPDMQITGPLMYLKSFPRSLVGILAESEYP